MNISNYQKCAQLCSYKFIEDNYCDLLITMLQMFCFMIKLNDKDELNI